MKKRFAILGIFACSILSCGDAAQTKPAEIETDTPSGVKCFSYTKNRDTIFVSIQASGKQVTGKMLYKLYEKDQNKGSLRGEMSADTLLADYTFQSEGMQSVRQVAFLQKGGTLTEGFGPLEEKEGKLHFVNTRALDFSGFVLSEVSCGSVDTTFKGNE